MTRRGLRFALVVGLLAGLSFPAEAAAEELTLNVVGNGVVTGTYGFLGGQSLECGPNETCEFEIPRACPFLQTCPPATPQPQTVDLTRSAPPSEWVFVEWSGGCSGSSTTCSILMDQDRSVTATYRRQLGRIVYTSYQDGRAQIYVMNADGTAQTRPKLTERDDGSAAWSPDGRRIVFSGHTGGEGTQIYVMDADGSGETELTNVPSNLDPSWSPDGQRIAFWSTRDGNREIYVMNADGSGETRLTNNSADDSAPAWSPDGRRIAFTSTRDGNGKIYVMNADGSGPVPLTSSSQPEDKPAWSPDGQRIVFSRVDAGTGITEIYVMNADGSEQTPLTASGADSYDPTWSPDGQLIAFWRDVGGEIYVMNADGSGEAGLPGPGDDDTSPSWTQASVRSQLFVAKMGSGSGTVSSSAGIDCGGDCWELYEPGTQVTLSAVPATGSSFAGWSDGCSGTQATCVLTMDASKRVTAAFSVLPVGQGPPAQGACTHTGTSGNDVIVGTSGNDVICAGAGNDIVRGLGGNDVIRLGAGKDKGYGGAGKDRIVGGKGRDRLFGGGGNDTLLARDRVKRELVDGGAGKRDRCRTDRGDIKRRCP
jgi:Tol biopolymer transport system component